MIEEITCKQCGKEMIEIRCKIICLQCGASEDCTDLTLEPYTNSQDEDEGGEP